METIIKDTNLQNITPLKLKILMAKHIKKCSRKLKDLHQIDICFTFKWQDGSTITNIGDKNISIKCEYNIDTFSEIVKEALKETLCDGDLIKGKNICKVIIYGKPVKSFNTLQNIIFKYAYTDIDKDTVKTEYMSDGIIDKSKTKYLCYDDEKCKEIIKYIRTNRTPKDILRCDYVTDRSDYPTVMNGIKLRIETFYGKLISERTVMIW